MYTTPMEEDQKLTKRERKALAKEQKRQEREAKEKKDKMTKWGVMGVVVLLIGFLGYRFFSAPSSNDSGNTSSLQTTFDTFATEIGLDLDQFHTDMQSDAVKDKINNDLASANALNLNSTPSFILNGELLDSSAFSNLEQFIKDGVANGSSGDLDVELNENDHMLGNPDATVVLVEYGDYQCPACGAVHPVVNQLMENLGEDVTLVFRHFPLVNLHANALPAAQAAEAAGMQGKFWEMHDKLYEHQSDWSSLK